MLTENMTELIPEKSKSASVKKINSSEAEICICNQKPAPYFSKKEGKLKKLKK